MGNLGGRMTTYLKPVVTGFLLCSFMAVMISISFAQATTGTITGIVVDQTGAVIVGASITARNIDTNITRTSQTGEVGRYSMPALPIGNYAVTVELAGFGKVVRGP